MFQKFYDTAWVLYAIRIWRLVIYVDNRAGGTSLRQGGIITHIGLARFVFWRFSWVGKQPPYPIVHFNCRCYPTRYSKDA